ncbi:putative S-adenosyl-L-methionine-dependent methyltransferase Mjls_1071 isoform X4 [Phoenix dactylifera]|uniref:S-adenosyl-L-methionine-dependent methyltransferase Mjls_1071 isoform X4 n=1 Tax=Phoenix dactylifera TaxID=42345 RepID=A0A8B8JBA4_PHODC|nr:putative S-adenosyl-L-methionine-dependent methyltransferase Mjls_1071 isoform X4 [Phoenix dactylifera]
MRRGGEALHLPLSAGRRLRSGKEVGESRPNDPCYRCQAWPRGPRFAPPSSSQGRVPSIPRDPSTRLATKFLDDKLLSLASSMDKVRQIVLLTDGMDTRPYRLSWPQPSIIYDVSPESVFKVASQRLKGAGAKISRNCMLVHVPLESSDLQAILCEKGFKGDKPSLWVLQGLPLLTSTGLNDILFAISNLAMKGSFLIGELPLCFLGTEIGDMPAAQKYMEKLFISHGFRADAFDYGEIAKNMLLEPPSGAYKNVLFIAEQLRLSDSQRECWQVCGMIQQLDNKDAQKMESWWMHFERMEEEGDEEGFEEL